MKGLFLVFHGFSLHSGISKKIFAQCEALRQNGVETELCYNRIDPDGTQRRMVGERCIHSFGRGLRAKITKRLYYGDLSRYLRSEKIDLLYIRHDLNANPLLVHWLKRVKKSGIRILLEIPTYPYDAEFKALGWKDHLQLLVDRMFRRQMARQTDRIITFSNAEEIFGQQTLRISNGIDFDTLPLKSALHDLSDEVHLLAVANIHPWHGFDRAIEGLRDYYATPRKRRVKLRIVGDGLEALLADYRQRIEKYGLQEYVEVTGPHAGTDLDADFEWCDAGIASLARHRSGITTIKTLKNREYAARGIPFVYSETDSDFDTMPYVCKVPADESAIDIESLLTWLDGIDRTPAAIRGSIEGTLSWRHQMQMVLEAIKQL